MNKFALLLFFALFAFNMQAQDTSELNFSVVNAQKVKSNFSQNLTVKSMIGNTILYTFAYTNGNCIQNFTGKATIKKTKKNLTQQFSPSSLNEYIDQSREGFNVLIKIYPSDQKSAVVKFITKDDIDLSVDCNPANYTMIAK